MSVDADKTLDRVRSRPRAAADLGWVHLCNGLDPRRDGGMVPSILGMTRALVARGERVTIATPTESRLDGVELPSGLRLHGPEFAMSHAVAGAEALHIHGLWQIQTRRGCRLSARRRVPYMISAHGMADPWALAHKRLKKKLYTTLIEANNLRAATCLHALARPEIEHLRALAPDAPITLIPNGVELAPFERLPDRSRLERDHPELAGAFTLLFFGRLHLKKGLDLLGEALIATCRDHPRLRLVLAGGDEGALAPLLAQLSAHGLRDRATALGHVSGERAREVWGAADAFVLPSRSEGFSMSVLEALAARRPALITTACNFPELDAARGGIVVEPSVAGVTRGLRELLERNDAERAELAERGRRLVERDYTWDRQGERLAEVYRWMAGGGPKPDSIVS